MLNLARRHITWPLAALACLFLVWGMASTRAFDACINPPQTLAPAIGQRHSGAVLGVGETFSAYGKCTAIFVVKERDTITAVSTLLLAIITVGLGFIARSQYRTSRAQLRAYVGVETANYSVNLPKHEARVRIRNFGQTPAYKVACSIGIEIVAEFTPATDGKKARIPGLATIYPQHSQTIRRKVDFVAPDGDGPVGIFVFGRIEYTDAFGDSRWTNFRFNADPQTGEMATSDEGGNDAN